MSSTQETIFASHLSISDIRAPISQVQLSTGDLVAGTFGVNESLSAVRLFVQIHHVKEEGKEVVFSTFNTNKIFEEEEYDCSLEELGLNFSRVLLKAEIVDSQVRITRVEPKRELDESFLSMQFRLAESQFARMTAHTGQRQEITSVDVVQNNQLRAVFKAKQKLLEEKGKGKSLLLFHGTPQANIKPILQNNFDLSITTNGRRFGNGVYFSERFHQKSLSNITHA